MLFQHILFVRGLWEWLMLDCIQIVGGKPLSGTISVQGSKNAALPMIAASLLHRGVSVLKNCPRLADVFYMERILCVLGAVTWWEGENLYLDCTNAEGTVIPEELSGKMRSSIILMGALLGRSKKAVMGYPGGCVIGKRPVDMHLYALRMLGAEIVENSRILFGSCAKMHGAEISFAKQSVGATQQGILAAVLAEGVTILKNCALEPEVVWLCRFLRRMGAKIRGEGTFCIEITGVEELTGGEITVPPDRIVAGTYFCAAAVTRGKIELKNVPEEEMGAFLEVYRKMGGQYKGKSGKLLVDGSGVHCPVSVKTDIYPGFPTDLQSPLAAVLLTLSGESQIKETIFENRFKALLEMRKMGADICIEGNCVKISGGKILKGCDVCAAELRGGAALILAGLAAEGVTTLWGYHYVLRGYACLAEELRSLGALVMKDTGIRIYEKVQLSKNDKYK